MTSDPIPEVPRRYQSSIAPYRASSAEAWAAAWTALSGGVHVKRSDLIEVMCAAGWVTPRTARDILIHAVDSGTLEVVSRDRFGRPTLCRPRPT
jgi:hypothetical protein